MALIRKEETLSVWRTWVSHVNSAIILVVLTSNSGFSETKPDPSSRGRVVAQNAEFFIQQHWRFYVLLEAFVNETCNLLDLFLFQILVTDI